MNYNQALDFINSDDKRGHHEGLENIKRLLDLLGNPQDQLKFIHITGTNGKGSTANFISLILEEAGYKTGLFVSPHILKINERFKINHIDINDDDFSFYMEKIKTVVEKNNLDFIPTYFEITVAIGFMYFKDNDCDIIVLEVGIGGKNDPTNIIKSPLLSVFTPIDIDHIERLGSKPEIAAKEKSMIIKSNSKAVSYSNSISIDSILIDRAKDVGSKISFLNLNDIEILKSNNDGSIFNYKNKEYILPLIGLYQIYNATLAILAVNELDMNISYENIYNAFKSTHWPARMTKLNENPLFIVDGAHNEHGFNSLINSLDNMDYKNLILGIGIMKDKNISENLKKLVEKADTIILTKIEYERAMNENKLQDLLPNKKYLIFSNLEDAINKSLEIADKEDLVLFCGSLYMAGEIIRIFNGRK